MTGWSKRGELVTDKKAEMMDTAIDLFSEKGYHFTSIQQITEACGISKGAFYKHFASKESMMLALLEKHQNTLLGEAELYNTGKDRSPYEQLISKIRLELEKSVEYRSFFKILFTEFMSTEDSEVNKKIKEFQEVLRNWHKRSLEEAFGPAADPIIQDLTAVLEGVLKEYLMLMMGRNEPLPLEKLARFIFETLHALVQRSGQIQPILQTDKDASVSAFTGREGMKVQLQLLLPEVNSQSSDTDRQKDKQTIEMALEELHQDFPREFLMEALLGYLQRRPYLSEKIENVKEIWKEWKGETSHL